MCAQYNRKDHLYQKAKEEGYRSRAAYKLVEMDTRFGLLRPGLRVLDVGAWPGGWSQVACEKVGPRGVVVAVDLEAMDPLPFDWFHFVKGDASDPAIVEQMLTLLGGPCDSVISDMSPKLSGIPEADQARIVALVELALNVGRTALKPGGSFVAKVFKGQAVDAFVKKVKPMFNKVTRVELDSTRSTSNEYYIVGAGYRRAA